MRLLFTILLLSLCLSAFAQNYDYLQAYRRFTLAGRAVKGISNDTSFLIGSADSLVTQYALKGYLFNHYGPGTNNIYGDTHQLLGAKYDNSNILEFLEPLVEGNFVTSDSELTAAKQQFTDQETIFNSWKRFSHGSGNVGQPVPSDTIPGVPLHTNSWSYDPTTQQISSTFNTSTHIGFVSADKYGTYTSSFTMRASGTDNDYVTAIIGYVEDANDMVRNNAYGLNPADFNWPINTTDQFIPNQHTITLVRGRTDQANFPFTVTVRYAIVYDLGKLTEQILVNGESLVWNTNQPYGSGAECDVKIIRNGDIIQTYTTDWSDAPGGKGTLGHELTFDLSSNPVTQKFRGSASYGYGALSQDNATFSNISVSPNRNTIYDLRNGQKWVADYAGNYSLDTGSYYIDYGVRRFLYNPYTLKTFYVKADKTFDILGSGDINQFSSDTTINNNYVTNQNTYVVAGDSAYLDSRDFSDTGAITDPIRTKPLVITSTGSIPSYNHDTKVLNIPPATDTTSLRRDINTNTAAIATKEPAIAAGTTFQYWRGDKTWQTFPTIPAQFNPIAGTNITITGTYPNLTFNSSGGVSSVAWGSITGTLSNQTDLQSALNVKEATITASNTSKKYWNGYKQFVSLNTDSIAEGATNKFYTDVRVRAAITLTTTGTSGTATYDSSTGVLNIPQYSGGGFTGWGLNGNAINPATDFIGTTNNTSVRTKTNGILRMTVDSTGNVGIGGTATSRLYVQAAANNNQNTFVVRNSANTANLLSQNENGSFTVSGNATFGGGVASTGTSSFTSNLGINSSFASFLNNSGFTQLRLFDNGAAHGSRANFGGTTIDNSAAVQIDNVTRGFLPPRMTQAQRDSMARPVVSYTITNGGTGGTPSSSSLILFGTNRANTVNPTGTATSNSSGAITSITITSGGSYQSAAQAGLIVGMVQGAGTGFAASATLGASAPAEGLVIYNLTTHQMNYWNGSTWVAF